MSAQFGTWREGQTIREAARAGAPVVDPAAWEPETLSSSDDWVYRFTDEDMAELANAVDRVEDREIDIVDVTGNDFPLPRLGELLSCARRELLDGRGLAVLRGLPVADWGRRRAAIAYFGMGHYIGTPISQNEPWPHIGACEGLRQKLRRPPIARSREQRSVGIPRRSCGLCRTTLPAHLDEGWRQQARQLRDPLQSDAGRSARSRRDPDRGFPLDTARRSPTRRQALVPPAGFRLRTGLFQRPGAPAPISARRRGCPAFHPSPTLRSKRWRCSSRWRPTVRRPSSSSRVIFSSCTTTSSCTHRTAYEDWPEPERKRHLLRLWLKDDDGRPVVPLMRESFQGIHVAGFQPVMPLDEPGAQAN